MWQNVTEGCIQNNLQNKFVNMFEDLPQTSHHTVSQITFKVTTNVIYCSFISEFTVVR